jgi:ABC-type Fe3+ transport system substrate-binding protein
MNTIKVIWRNGVTWNPDAASMIDASKKKTAVEHLIETGGQTLDEAIDAFSYFKPMPIKVVQQKVEEDPSINWITVLEIIETDPDKANTIKEELVGYYSRKQTDLANTTSGYTIEIITD